MKHLIRIIILAVAFVTGIMTVSAQMVQVVVVQKVPTLPATASNYLDDPFRYFSVQLVVNGLESEGLDVFLDIDYSLDNDGGDDVFYLRTKQGSIPYRPVHISNGINQLNRDDLQLQLRDRRETNYNFSNPLEFQLLPEGTYQLCIDVYLWSDRFDPARQPISDDFCPSYDVCYSGSAPELVSPLTGAQMALNGAMVVTPNRKVNFLWTPVISNCAGKTTRFKYLLKVVKVLKGQNYNDAIKYNPTVFSAEVRNSTHVSLDTLRDIKVHLEDGSLYVAQVQAEAIMTRGMDAFVVANDGKSQPMPFYWRNAPEGNYYIVDEEEKGEEGEGAEGLTQWEGGVEEYSELDDMLSEAFPDEQNIVLEPKRHYVESDGYYTIPAKNDIEVGFMPVQEESLKNVHYTIELYDFVDGGVDSITAYEPLLSESIEKLPENYKMDSHEWINRTLAGWGAELEQGNLYYLQLSSNFSVSYWNYSVADTVYYVNEILAEHFHDTISREFVEEELVYSDGVFFQWGDDPEAPEFTTPQWKSPVNRTGDDIYDPMNYEIPASVPEVQKTQAFPVSWTSVKHVAKGDVVEYEVNVYELKPGQTLEEAVWENEALVTRTVTDATQISGKDTAFFKVFSPKKTYVMTLTTNVDGESDTFYHFANGNAALPIVFKVVK